MFNVVQRSGCKRWGLGHETKNWAANKKNINYVYFETLYNLQNAATLGQGLYEGDHKQIQLGTTGLNTISHITALPEVEYSLKLETS